MRTGRDLVITACALVVVVFTFVAVSHAAAFRTAVSHTHGQGGGSPDDDHASAVGNDGHTTAASRPDVYHGPTTAPGANASRSASTASTRWSSGGDERNHSETGMRTRGTDASGGTSTSPTSRPTSTSRPTPVTTTKAS